MYRNYNTKHCDIYVKKLQIARAQVNTLPEAAFTAKLLFKRDLANYLEAITAQRNALQAELNPDTIQRPQLSAKI